MTETDSQSQPADDTGLDQRPEVLATVVKACNRFLDNANAISSPLVKIAGGATATLDRQISRLRSEIESSGRLEWDSVSTYITSLQESTIDPLQHTLSKIDVVSSTADAWDDANGELRASLDRLSTRDRLALSPHVRFVEGIANSVAEVEFGVSAWVSAVLDAASIMVEHHDEAVDSNGELDSATADPGQDPFVAAGIELEQRLRAAAEHIGSLRADILQSIESAAGNKLSSLEKTADAAADEEPGVSKAIDDLIDFKPWFEQVESRMNLSSARWSLFRSTAKIQDSLIGRVREESLADWFEANQLASKAMADARDTAMALFDELQESGSLRPAVRKLIELLRSTTQLLDTELSSKLDIEGTTKSIDTVSHSAIGQLDAIVQTLPGALVVHASKTTAEIKSSAATREIDLRAAASAAIEKTLTADSATWSGSIQARLEISADEADNLLPVLRVRLKFNAGFNQETARPRVRCRHQFLDLCRQPAIQCRNIHIQLLAKLKRQRQAFTYRGLNAQ